MFFRLLLLMTAVPILELLLLLQVHHSIAQRWGTGMGLLATVGMVIATGVGGAALARHQGLGVLRATQESLRRGDLPGPELVDALLVIVGAALLLTPGFVTDFIGFGLLVPFTRSRCRNGVLHWFRRQIERGQFVVYTTQEARPDQHPFHHDNVIDVKARGSD